MNVVSNVVSYGKVPSMAHRSLSDWILYICLNWNVVESSGDFDWSVIISIYCEEMFDEFCTARTNIEAKLTG
jgi:hypothetical protein